MIFRSQTITYKKNSKSHLIMEDGRLTNYHLHLIFRDHDISAVNYFNYNTQLVKNNSKQFNF